MAAHPHTSLPKRATGIVAAWIGVGCTKFMDEIAFMRGLERFISWKLLAGSMGRDSSKKSSPIPRSSSTTSSLLFLSFLLASAFFTLILSFFNSSSESKSSSVSSSLPSSSDSSESSEIQFFLVNCKIAIGLNLLEKINAVCVQTIP